MVRSHSSPLDMATRFIYITGCDGTGKSTQANLLFEKLTTQGIETRHVWLRFPFFLSIPLLAYARLRGFSWYEIHDDFRHGYWDFRSSWLLRTCLPWLMLVDAAIATIPIICLPLWFGKTIICERFVLDMLVDLSIAISDETFHKMVPGKLFLRLIPPQSRIILLDLDVRTIRQRRPDLDVDLNLEDRVKLYRRLMDDLSLHTFSSQLPEEQINGLIFKEIFGETGNY
ncbi:MAG: thymidylate kinase-like protein [Chloroflexota bacterium]|nr:MAG: thymidylate kinase-like protein [Chloroflexota bacterium]